VHTPGEWKLKRGDDGWTYVEKDGMPIAKVMDRRSAALMAVAPLLYDYVRRYAERDAVAERLIARADGVEAFDGIR
jgi:hypothetical protein